MEVANLDNLRIVKVGVEKLGQKVCRSSRQQQSNSFNNNPNNQVLSDSQHGFRAGFSCTTQLVSLIDDVSYNMDARRQVDSYDPFRFFEGF